MIIRLLLSLLRNEDGAAVPTAAEQKKAGKNQDRDWIDDLEEYHAAVDDDEEQF